MRTIIISILAFAIAAYAAEAEQFTLKDGRVLVGTYDEATGMLTITGGALKVKPDAIAWRDKAPLDGPHKPKSIQPKPAVPSEEKRELEPAPLALSELPRAIWDRYYKEEKEAIEEVRKRKDAAMIAAILRLDTRPIFVPPLSKDPKQSELTTHNEIMKLNQTLAYAKQWVDGYKTWKKNPGTNPYLGERGVVPIDGMDESFDRSYAKYKLRLDLPKKD